MDEEMLRFTIALIVMLTMSGGAASAATSVFPTSIFQASNGTNANNLLGNTPQSARLNRNQSIILNFGAPIANFNLTLNISSVSAGTTYVWVRFGQVNGGAFTNAPGAGLLAPNGAATANFYALVTGAGQLIVPGAAFATACNSIGGCNAIVFGNSTFSANGSQFRINSFVASSPEPAAWLMMIAGFFGVAARLKQVRKNSGALSAATLNGIQSFG
jgi:hypothetical protein